MEKYNSLSQHQIDKGFNDGGGGGDDGFLPTSTKNPIKTCLSIL